MHRVPAVLFASMIAAVSVAAQERSAGAPITAANADRLALERELRGHDGRVRFLAFSSGGLLASGGIDGTIRLWDLLDAGDPRARGILRGHTG